MARKDDIMLFALIIGVLAFLRRKVEWGTGWMWPVPTLRTRDGSLYEAVITDGLGSPRGTGVHRGVDIMYRRKSKTDRPEYKSSNGKTPGESSGPFFMPNGVVPIVAARDGFIWSAGKTPRGFSVVLDHGKPFATYYTHMIALAVALHANGKNTIDGTRTPVKAGDVIGLASFDPMDHAKTVHLHFSVAHNGPPESAAVDPEEAMRTWTRPPRTFDL
jgi:murein DD-endopeptidase MepM/ murein hydrolase activator NlpD